MSKICSLKSSFLNIHFIHSTKIILSKGCILKMLLTFLTFFRGYENWRQGSLNSIPNIFKDKTSQNNNRNPTSDTAFIKEALRYGSSCFPREKVPRHLEQLHPLYVVFPWSHYSGAFLVMTVTKMAQFSSAQSLSHVQLFVTPWIAERQASLSITNSRSPPKPMSSSRWYHPAISSSVVPFSSCPQSFPASGSFQMSQLSASGGQSIGVSASTSLIPMNTQDWSPLGWTGWIPLQSRGTLKSLLQHHSSKASMVKLNKEDYTFILHAVYCHIFKRLTQGANAISLIFNLET